MTKKAPNLLDGADYKPYLPADHPESEHPESKVGKERAAKAAAPVASGQVASGEPMETVPTNYGDLDADAVINNRIGGVGVVHMLADPPVEGASTGPVVAGTGVREHHLRAHEKSETHETAKNKTSKL